MTAVPASPRASLTRAGVAGALGLLLLTGPAVTHARWNETRQLTAGQIRTGQLDVSLGEAKTILEHTDLAPSATTTTETRTTTSVVAPGTTVGNLTPGDVLTTTVPVALTATGTNLTATLRVDPAAPAGTAALGTEVATGTTMTLDPVGTAPALSPVPGQPRSWGVSAAHDQATYLLTVSTRIRPTTNGSPRATLIGTGNWWGTSLQGAAVEPRELTVRLIQN